MYNSAESASPGFRFSIGKPNHVSNIAIYFPGFGQNAETLKQYCTRFRYIDGEVERSYYVTSFREQYGEPRRFLSFQGIGRNVELIMQQVEEFLEENKVLLQRVVLVGHSMGALYASFCLMRLREKYPNIAFELHELARPPFKWRAFLHKSFLKHGGLIATFHALGLMMLCLLTLGLVRKYRGYRSPRFAVQGLFVNELAQDRFADDIVRSGIPDATLAYFSAALIYGAFSSFRYSEVERARQKGWYGKHVVYAAKDDRVFRYQDEFAYAQRHESEFRTMSSGFRNRDLLKIDDESIVTHCPYF